MGGDLLGLLDGSAVFEVGGDAGGPEGVVADAGGEAGGDGPALDHVEGVATAERKAGDEAGLARDGAEEEGFRLLGDAGGLEIGVQVFLGEVVGGQLVEFSALLVEA